MNNLRISDLQLPRQVDQASPSSNLSRDSDEWGSRGTEMLLSTNM